MHYGIVTVLKVLVPMQLISASSKIFLREIRSDFMRFISKFHKNGILAKILNYTFIVPIPKVESPQGLLDFRPIS